jgi:hypothetical protein
LPSAKLVTIVVSLVMAGGLVTGAQYITREPGRGSIAASPDTAASDLNWQNTLEQIQLDAGVTAPQPPPQNAVDELLAAAQSTNLTNSIGRSLLVNLSAAGAQGLGTDIPTQDAIIESAAAKVGADMSASYTQADMIRVAQTKESLHTYGDALLTVLTSYPGADSTEVLYAFGAGVDYQTPAKLAPVRTGRDAYLALAEAVLQVPVPETVAPLHLAVANNLSAMGKAAGEMLTVLEDPLRGLGGLQIFQTKGDEASRLLTAIARMFENNGILFTKDDPGAAWSVFVQ